MKHIRSMALSLGLLGIGAAGYAVGGGAPPGWPGSVNQLAAQLSERASPDSLRQLFSDRFVTQSLDGASASIEQLAPLLSSVDWVEQLSYNTTPDTLATDIAAAVKRSALPDELRQYFAPGGNQPERTANLTAMKWIGQQLKARADQPVGIILAHSPSTDPKTEPHGRVIVILLAGEMVGFEQYRIRQIAFGTFTPAK